MGRIVGFGGMVSEVPEDSEETVGFLWASHHQLIRHHPKQEQNKKRARGSDTMKVF